MTKAIEVDINEAIKLGAVDGTFYSRYFFPKTFRQASPAMHRDMWSRIDRRGRRLKALKCFRGSAKTTIARSLASKRIAYADTRTMLFVGKSEMAAKRNLRWLMKQVEFNTVWASAFGLSKGAKWNEEHIEVNHELAGHSINILPVGMTGSLRGINLDDWRPDFILVDDPCDTENTATPEARKKTADLFFGDLINTLAPTTESPDAQVLLLQTPLNAEDLIETACRDPSWETAVYGCFDDKGESRWPERFTTDYLRQEKEAYIQRNQLSLWMREMECKVIASELSSFKSEWLKYWNVLPDGMTFVLAIDPASSESKTADDTAMIVLGFRGPDIYIVEERTYRGYDFDKFSAEFIGLLIKYRPRKVAVESIAYQRVLAWHLRNAMEKHGIYAVVEEVEDRRKKSDRIIQALSGPASFGHVYCRANHFKFIQQFTDYGPLAKIHDDVLDSVAIAITANTYTYNDSALEAEFARLDDEEKHIPAIANWRSAP